MRLAVMQPYVLPYLGYFQLLTRVDRFVFLDDVAYINRGWINRNRILLGGEPHTFTLSLKDASQNKKICEIELATDERWRSKFFKTLETAYKKAPQYAEVMPLLGAIFDTPERNLSAFVFRSMELTAKYLSIPTELSPSSSAFGGADLKAQDRILHICEQNAASEYINLPGGRELYDAPSFASRNIALGFLRPELTPYRQFDKPFVPALSIVDVMMFNSRSAISELLGAAGVEP